ncbi:MAG TPA: NAD(P)/FAD-dependent oxidoreductase [Bryobacteraceae bacterium]|jgi:phytoene dehydrogenase-like protein|nr:NAD(P)/FAD-dependent oxidoreductase [Bryobacteraceae bacterium]
MRDSAACSIAWSRIEPAVEGETVQACVVGSGPNGLTAAIVLARAGLRTTVLEAEDTIGGGARTLELTLPGFRNDLCSAIHPMALSSPAFASFPLREHGLEWIQPPLPAAHPLDDGTAAILFRDLNEASAHLGPDGPRYRRFLAPLVRNWPRLSRAILRPIHIPRHPLLLARFGMLAGPPAAVSARYFFRSPRNRALFAGIAAHAVMPLDALASGAFGWALIIAAHAAGWPLPRGGSQSIASALASYFRSLGGEIVAGARVASLDQLGNASPILLDITPKQFLEIAGNRLPASYRRKMEKYRYGPGAFKLDYALRAPIPWTSPACRNAGTVHLGGSWEEIERSEREAAGGIAPEKPLVLLTQPSLFDPTRAPAGQHTAWAYCHVPNGCEVDMTGRIEAQIERFAPGFRAIVLKRTSFSPRQMEQHNANLIGGDIMGGAHTLKQILLRPSIGFYRTPLKNVYLCSSSTPPGGGVHGMCGYNAAHLALGALSH